MLNPRLRAEHKQTWPGRGDYSETLGHKSLAVARFSEADAHADADVEPAQNVAKSSLITGHEKPIVSISPLSTHTNSLCVPPWIC